MSVTNEDKEEACASMKLMLPASSVGRPSSPSSSSHRTEDPPPSLQRADDESPKTATLSSPVAPPSTSLTLLKTDDSNTQLSVRSSSQPTLQFTQLLHVPAPLLQPISRQMTCLADIVTAYSDTITSMDSLYRKFVMVVFLRRFGCPVCRALSTGLSHFHKILEKNGISFKLMAIAIEEVGFELYHQHNYFSGDVYVNEDGSLFELLKFKRLGVSSALNVNKMRKMRAAVKLAVDPHFRDQMDFKGNLMQLGGMLILNVDTREVVFEYRESYAGDSPLLQDVLSVLNVDPQLSQSLFPEASSTRFLQLAQEALVAMRAQGILNDHNVMHT